MSSAYNVDYIPNKICCSFLLFAEEIIVFELK